MIPATVCTCMRTYVIHMRNACFNMASETCGSLCADALDMREIHIEYGVKNAARPCGQTAFPAFSDARAESFQVK